MANKRSFSPVRILLDPWRYVIISIIAIGAAVYLIANEVDFKVLQATDLHSKMIFCLLAAILCVLIRIVCYMWRLKVLSDHTLSWKQVFQVVSMWEFTSAITPSAVGGAPVAIYYLSKEGLSVGKSTSVVMMTALMDEIFFIILLPMCYLFMQGNLFPSVEGMAFLEGVKYIFFTSYFLILLYAFIISYGVIINPHGLKRLLVKIFKLPFLKRWKDSAEQTGDDIILSSKEIKGKSAPYWIKSLFATFTSWSARFILVNFLILGLIEVSDHFLIYGRQLVMWVIMLISPTPGSSGVAEAAFNVYLKEFIPEGMSGLLALVWRLLSYYLYILLGFIVLPRWLKRVLIKRKLIKFKS